LGRISVEQFRTTDGPGEVPVRGFLHRPDHDSGDGLILTHGAGGNCNAPLLIALGDAISAAGIAVLRCDLPFRQLRPHGPPSPAAAERDRQGLRRAVSLMQDQFAGRLFLGGQSYGGRQASMLAASDLSLVAGLLLLSYPLHAPGRSLQPRTAHFPQLRVPALFVSGTKDAFGSVDELSAAARLIAAPSKLVHIEGAGHGLLTKTNREELVAAVSQAFVSFFATA
jgi:uncharacterized protein